MGLLKIGDRISGVNSHRRQISKSSNVAGMELEEHQVSGGVSGDDPDDSELTEVRCEFGMVEGQLCNIPYELYDLRDLREILSLDTWNSSLTEEERFCLCAYLPDMDQQSFWLTMMELLGGSDMFFGNPLDIFFKRLKGGFYPPELICFREGLLFLERRKYYHSLRSYHENMAQMFIDMGGVWNRCEMSTGVEERVYIWRIRKNHEGADLLDLNTYPEDGYLLSKEVDLEAKICHSKTKSVESKRGSSILPSVVNRMNSFAPNCSGKGVLKVKASVNGSFQKWNPESVRSDTMEWSRSAAKGVLKIVPKVPSIQLEQSKAKPGQLQPTLFVNSQGLKDPRFSSLAASVYELDAGGFCESPSLQQMVDSSEVQRTLKQPDCILVRPEVDLLNSTTRPIRHSESSVRKINSEKNPSLHGIADLQERKSFGVDAGTCKGDGRGHNGEHKSLMDSMNARRYACGSENLRQTLGVEKRELSARTLEPYPFGIQFCEGERCMEPLQEHMTIYSQIPEVVSGIGTGEQEMSMAFADQVKSQTDVNFRGSEKPYGQPRISLGDELVLPITYNRRKALAKLHSLDSGNPLTAEADLSSISPKKSNHHLGETAKAVKIKFKCRKDQILNKES